MSNKAKSLVYSITINVNVLGAFIFLSFCKTSGTWKNLFLYVTMLTRNYKHALFVRNVLKKENPQVFHEMYIIICQIKTPPTTPELLYHFLDILQVKTTHFGQYSVKFIRDVMSFKEPRILTCQLLNLLNLKKHCFRHITITIRAIYYLIKFLFIFMPLIPISFGDSYLILLVCMTIILLNILTVVTITMI